MPSCFPSAGRGEENDAYTKQCSFLGPWTTLKTAISSTNWRTSFGNLGDVNSGQASRNLNAVMPKFFAMWRTMKTEWNLSDRPFRTPKAPQSPSSQAPFSAQPLSESEKMSQQLWLHVLAATAWSRIRKIFFGSVQIDWPQDARPICCRDSAGQRRLVKPKPESIKIFSARDRGSPWGMHMFVCSGVGDTLAFHWRYLHCLVHWLRTVVTRPGGRPRWVIAALITSGLQWSKARL